MDCQLDHVGYITDDIAKTAESFRLLGYEASDIVNDDTQRTSICFLTKQGATNIELVKPYEDMRALTAAEIQEILNNAENYSPEEYIKKMRIKKTFMEVWLEKKKQYERNSVKIPDWLEKWKDYKLS